MILHPLLIGLYVLVLISTITLVISVIHAGRITLHWNPQVSDKLQLTLEHILEELSLMGRTSLVITLLTALTFIIAIVSVLPTLIPGAMCGTGVIEALGSSGKKTIVLSLVSVLILLLWLSLDRINRSSPVASLAALTSKLYLVAALVSLLSNWFLAKSILFIDATSPVDCCAAVLESAQFGLGTFFLNQVDILTALGFFAIGGGCAIVLHLLYLTRQFKPLFVSTYVFIFAVFSVPILINTLSAYHFEVLFHPCPWCLFLPEHNYIGYPMLFALVAISSESIVLFVLSKLVSNDLEIVKSIQARSKRSSAIVIIMLLLYITISIAPVILWKFQFGVWLSP